jgi:membrane-associated phospholipid phosphatase
MIMAWSRRIAGQSASMRSTRAEVRRARFTGFSALACYLVLSVLVGTGLTETPDGLVREWFRPGDVWGTQQLRVDHIVDGLRPAVALPAFVVLAILVVTVRRVVWPVLAAGAVLLLMIAVTVATKALIARPDPHGAISTHGGSYPSGHTVSVMVCVGLAVCLLWPGARGLRFWSVPLAVGLAMGLSLLIQAAHWAGDVAGGLLLGVAALSLARLTVGTAGGPGRSIRRIARFRRRPPPTRVTRGGMATEFGESAPADRRTG